jgi:cystathionine beta-lyase/cystathionine gamma-synthase
MELNFEVEKREGNDGLPTRAEVEEQFAKIDDTLQVLPERNYGFPSDELIFSRGQGGGLSAEQYAQFKKEFQEDLAGLKLRLQRLKIRLLGPMLKGYARTKQDEKEEYSEKDKSTAARLSSLVGDFKYHKRPLDQTGMRQLISSVNRSLPAEYHLGVAENLSVADVELLYKLTFNLRFESSKKMKVSEKKLYENAIGAITELERILQHVEQQEELFTRGGSGFQSEENVKQVWSEYRQLLKQFAALEEAENWFSPTYGASGKGQQGTDQSPERLRTDYQRFKMPEIEALEAELCASYFGEHDYHEYVKSLVFGSGLAALQAILLELSRGIAETQSLMKEKKSKKSKKRDIIPDFPALKVVKTSDIYFEVDSLVQDHFKQLGVPIEEIDPANTTAIIAKIQEELPVAVFLNPMSNMYDMRVTEVRNILAALMVDYDYDKEPAWRKRAREQLSGNQGGYFKRFIYIVIDNSTLGRLAKWRELDFRRLPSFIRIVSFESLIKYAEDGQDMAPAALVTTIGQSANEGLREIRSRAGFMPPENTVRKLKNFVPVDVTDKKMARHTRNSEMIGAELEEAIKDSDGLLARVIYPGLASNPEHEKAEAEMHGAGGLLGIGFNFRFLKNYRELQFETTDRWGVVQREYKKPIPDYEFKKTTDEIASAFDNLIILLAKQAGVEINQGTSYGFHTTRIAVYDRLVPENERISKAKERKYNYGTEKYIRVSVGTENIKDTQLIVEIIKRANQIFTEAKNNQRLFKLAEQLNNRRSLIKFGSEIEK